MNKKRYITPTAVPLSLQNDAPLLVGSLRISEEEVSSGMAKENEWSDIWNEE